MRSWREIELFLGHCTHEKPIPKALPMNECLKAELWLKLLHEDLECTKKYLNDFN